MNINVLYCENLFEYLKSIYKILVLKVFLEFRSNSNEVALCYIIGG